MARSTGVFPREKFDLDGELLLTFGEGEPAGGIAPIDLKSINTIRVVVLGAGGLEEDPGDFDYYEWVLGGGGEGPSVIIAYVDGQLVYFWDDDIDANGVGIKHVRGSLCGDTIFEEELPPNTVAFFTLTETVSFTGLYIDAVDNVG